MSQTQDVPDYRSTSAPPGTPRWVKALGIIVLILVLLVGVMLLSGHDPSRHMHYSGDDPASPTMEMEQTGQQP